MGEQEGAVLILVVIFAFVTLIVWVGTRHKLRSERLRVIEKAIESGALDESTRRLVLESLGGVPKPRSAWAQALGQHVAFLARNVVFIGGWITMFVGSAFWILGETMDQDRSQVRDGAVAAIVGFALVTVPLALRELENRRRERA